MDWYDQRIDATGNEELAAILAHNRGEEKEHAAMVLRTSISPPRPSRSLQPIVRPV